MPKWKTFRHPIPRDCPVPSATQPNPLQPLSGAAENPSLQAEADRDGLAWAMQHREKERADAEFEAKAESAPEGPRLLDRGEWEMWRMERDEDPNARYFDGRSF